MRSFSNARNIAIILALAVIVDVVKGGQTAANTITQAISLAFLALIVWIATRLYREHRSDIYLLGSKRRAILYGAIAVATLLFTASGRMFNSAGGTFVWLVLMAAAAYAVYAVFRSSREY